MTVQKGITCVLCGDHDEIGIPGPREITPEGTRERGDVCLNCFLLIQRINDAGLDLLGLVSQLDILAGSVLGETGPVPSMELLREWAIQLRDQAAPVLEYIYRDGEIEETPIPLLPEPPEGVDPLSYYLELMDQHGY